MQLQPTILRSVGAAYLLIGLGACSQPDPASIAAESAPTLIAATRPRSWNYVAIGGDFTYGHGWDDLFAAHLQDDLGVDIRFQDLSTHDNIRLPRWIERIQSDDDLRKAVEDADVLTVDVQVWAYLSRAEALFQSGFCGGEDNEECLREALADLEGDVDPFFDEVTRLADPSLTLVYTFDLGNFLYYAPLDDNGFFGPPFTEEQKLVVAGYALEAFAAVRKAAEARGITVVDLVPSFQPDGPFTPPPEEDYFLMLGFSAEGEEVIADLLRQQGYEYHRPLTQQRPIAISIRAA